MEKDGSVTTQRNKSRLQFATQRQNLWPRPGLPENPARCILCCPCLTAKSLNSSDNDSIEESDQQSAKSREYSHERAEPMDFATLDSCAATAAAKPEKPLLHHKFLLTLPGIQWAITFISPISKN